MMQRRSFLAAMALATMSVSRHSVLAAPVEMPFDIRIGYQKSSLLAIAKKQRVLEDRFGADRISWLEFSHGPPLLEALAAGRIDYGYAGNAPPIFAQAAHAPFFYVAAQPVHGENVGIVVAEGSSLQSLKDLRGRKVAVAKGSSGHDLLVAALESAGLTYADIAPVYLAPADAAAAFATGAVEAWSIWDPFFCGG